MGLFSARVPASWGASGPAPWVCLAACLVAGFSGAHAQTLAFVTEGLPDAGKGLEYGVEEPSSLVFITATGGTFPYAFRLLSGTLPPGISFGVTGRLSGTPLECGNFIFQAQVRDAIGDTANRTFLLEVAGVATLGVAESLEPSIEAGARQTVTIPLVNTGCSSLQFHVESEDLGPVLPLPAAAPTGLAGLLAVGGPIPRAIGAREDGEGPVPGAWIPTIGGDRIDAEGNRDPRGRSPAPQGFIEAGQQGVTVLYVNQSSITGERERLEALGAVVVQALVPEALDLETLQAFDILWLTASSSAAALSRETIRRFVWQGGGLVLGQIEASGSTTLLPPGYAISGFPTPPTGNLSVVVFTPAAETDPLTSSLEDSDLPANFDTVTLIGSGSQWAWLAVQADTPVFGTLARADYGGGQIIYHSGNLGTGTAPGIPTGGPAFIEQILDVASSGIDLTSCIWLEPMGATSRARPEEKETVSVAPQDLTEDLVNLAVEVDARDLPPGQYACALHIITDVAARPDAVIQILLTVSAPPVPRITDRALLPAVPGQPYLDQVEAVGGTPPYLFTIVEGTLPPGIDLAASTGVLSGLPGGSGSFPLRLRVTDFTSASSEADLTLRSGLVLLTEILPDAILGGIYAAPIFASGGTPPYRFTFDDPIDYTLPATDSGSPAGQACSTADLGGGRSATSCTLPTGFYRIVYSPVGSLITPAAVDAEVLAAAATLVDGHYAARGSITVNTNLESASFVLRAENTAVGDLTIEGFGLTETFNDLPPGDYDVVFGSVLGYATPPTQSGILLESGSLTFDATYVLVATSPAPALSFPAATPRGSAAAPPRAPQADSGFETGTLVVTTDAAGATFRLVGLRRPTFMTLLDPCNGVPPILCQGAGGGASLFGIMLTEDSPGLVSGQKISLGVQVDDAAGNRARRTYAPVARIFPSLTGITPESAGQGQGLALNILGSGLSESATLSFGDDVEVVNLGVRLGEGLQIFLATDVTVDSLAATGLRDLIYTDPTLAQTAIGSTRRVEGVLRLFAGLNSMDLDGTGRVDGFDLAVVARVFGLSSGQPGYDPRVDFTKDGTIDGDDLVSFAVVFSRLALSFDPADLPPPVATLGVAYEASVGFIGGNPGVQARVLGGELPDGLTLILLQTSDLPADSELFISGIPAEAGTFTLTVQVVDSYFALAVEEIEVTVVPPAPLP